MPDTTTGSYYGIWHDYYMEPTGNVASQKMGHISLVRMNTNYDINEVRGFNQVGNFQNSASGNVTKWTNVVSRINQNADSYTGTVTDYYGFEVFNNKQGTNNISITNWHGYYHPAVAFTGTQNVGFECGDVTGATNNLVGS